MTINIVAERFTDNLFLLTSTMKPSILFKLFILSLFSCLVACHSNTSKHQETSVGNPIQYAKGFTISYHENYKVITVLTPWKDAKEQFKYILVQRGTAVPKGYQ